MLKKVVPMVVLMALCSAPAFAQGGTDKLATLILRVYGPDGLFVDSEAVLPSGATHSAHFNSAFQSEFTKINLALPTQLLTVPLPSPASGATYTTDPITGIPRRSTQSWGPILSDRAETIGKGRYSFGFAYQHFNFSSIDGLDLDTLPAVFSHDGAAPGGKADLVSTVNAIDANTDRFTTFFTYGLLNRVDLSVAIPMVSTRMTVTSFATVERIGTASNTAVHFFGDATGGQGDTRNFTATDSATGIGDIVLRAKGRFADFGCADVATAGEADLGCTHLAAGANLRLPTGDEMDLLGVGGPGFAPFFVASFNLGKITPHVNLAYEWNGSSVLAGNPATGEKGSLPNQFVYTLGLDVGITEGLTFVFDILGRTVFDATQLSIGTFTALDGTSTFDNIEFQEGNFNIADAAVGLKFNAYRDLLIDFNVLFKLNDSGIRARVSPLIGVEYSF
jgi:hypothetical protein